MGWRRTRFAQDIARLWTLVAHAITRCDQAAVYDNHGIKGPRIVAQMRDGLIVGSPTWPDWAPTPRTMRRPAVL
jgi:predicted ABC-type ATPase